MMFGGIVARQAGRDPRDWISPERLEALIDPYRHADRIGHCLAGPALLAQAIRWNTAESRHAVPPERCRDTGRILAGWLRLDNRAELCVALGIELRQTLTDGRIVLAAHRLWGREAAVRLEGEFAFAIHDPASGATWCVRDVMGTRPFFYHATPDLFAFGATAALFPALRGSRIGPSQQWMARFLLGYSHDHRHTALDGVLRLPPAHDMLVEPGAEPAPQSYFAFADPEPGIGQSDDAHVVAYREALDRAVGAAMRSAYPIAAELSGGLDSSAIVASARRQMGPDRPLHTAGLLMYQEDASAQAAVATHCGLHHHHTFTPDMSDWHLATQARAAAALGFPLEHPNAGYHFALYEHCADNGIRTLLSGFGGDEIVTSGGRELYGELLRARRYGDWWRVLGPSTLARTRGALRYLRSHGSAGPLPNPAQAAFLAQLEATPLRENLVTSLGLAEWQMQRGDIFVGDTPNATILRRAFRAYVAGRFESCSAIAASYGIEYRWPLVERQLVQSFLATPSIERHRHGIGRYLHRRANSGRLPDEIVWHAKSMGPVRPEARYREDVPVVKNITLLSPRLRDILDHAKYLELGESVEQRSLSEAEFGNAGTYRRELIRRIALLSDWLVTFDQNVPGVP